MYYLQLAFRQLLRQKLNTALHLLGLTLGMTTCLLIYLLVRYEAGYDGYHSKADRVYRVNYSIRNQSDTDNGGLTPYPTGQALRADFPELEKVVRLQQEDETLVEVGPGKRFQEEEILFADPELLDVLDYTAVQGDPRSALRNPSQVVLTAKTARKYFGMDDPMGKTLKLGNLLSLEVGAVVADPPGNTNFPASLLIPYARFDSVWTQGMDITQWGFTSGGSVLVLLSEGLDPQQINRQLGAFAKKYVPVEPGQSADFELQRLTAIHTEPQWRGTEFVPAVSPIYLWMFGSIGLAVLVLACINFINLSTAQAMTRMREVGVRKAVGARQYQLLGQFWTEAWVLAGMAGLLAVGLTALLIPAVNQLLHQRIAFNPLVEPALLGVVAGGIAFTSFLAGFYPAYIIARQRPIASLKASVATGDRRSAWLRRGLVVFQFAVSAGLITAVMVVSRQMQYIREKNLGFDREHIVVLPIPEKPRPNVRLAQEWLNVPGVERVSFGLGAPTSDSDISTSLYPAGRDAGQSYTLQVKPADHEYLTTYGLKLLAGRWLEPSDTLLIAKKVPSEQRKYRVVVNEELVRLLDVTSPEAAVGKRIQIGLNDLWVEIIGVVGDFHHSSLRKKVEPTLLMNFTYFYTTASLRLSAGANLPHTLAALEKSWTQAYPNYLFEAEFVDRSLQELYQAEAQTFRLFQVFAGVAILISCLGLWGLATYAALQRRKEIGVRKVLGASSAQITALLVSDFLKLVMAALVIASPAALWLMDRWLQDFAYRVYPGWDMVVLPGVLAAGIAFLTVSYQSIKAALSNPVESLRTE